MLSHNLPIFDLPQVVDPQGTNGYVVYYIIIGVGCAIIAALGIALLLRSKRAYTQIVSSFTSGQVMPQRTLGCRAGTGC